MKIEQSCNERGSKFGTSVTNKNGRSEAHLRVGLRFDKSWSVLPLIVVMRFLRDLCSLHTDRFGRCGRHVLHAHDRLRMLRRFVNGVLEPRISERPTFATHRCGMNAP